MLVKVIMKDGTRYEGVKCGSEGVFIYLVNAVHCVKEEDASRIPDDIFPDDLYYRSDVGDEVAEDTRVLLLPINDIKSMKSMKE